MATTIETQGHTVDEAIQIALNQLGVSRDKVEIEILHHPRRGIFGIGARRAKVRAVLRAGVFLDGEEFDMSSGEELQDKPRRRRRRGGRSRGGRERGEGAEQPRAGAGPSSGRDGARDGGRRGSDADAGRRGSEGDAGSRGRRGRSDDREGDRSEKRRDDRREGGGAGRGRDDQRRRRPEGANRGNERRGGDDRNAGRSSGPRVAEAPATSASAAAVAPPPAPRAGMEARPPATRPAQPAREPTSARPAELYPEVEASAVEPIDAETLRERAHEAVGELLARMGFAATVTSSVDTTSGEVVVAVNSDSEGLLIGRRGQTLDSLEHVVNRMVLRGEPAGDGRVMVDIGDYRRRRQESLQELAGRLRARALREQRSMQVSPMSPRDRKFFQTALESDEAVEVRALGAGFYRRLVVAPAGSAVDPAAASDDSEIVDEEGGDEGFVADQDR